MSVTIDGHMKLNQTDSQRSLSEKFPVWLGTMMQIGYLQIYHLHVKIPL